MDDRDVEDHSAFEDHREHLRAVAHRMLGSATEADDAVQEAWLRYQRADTGAVTNLGGWLTTVVARVCLDMLRSRAARREQPVGAQPPEPTGGDRRLDPEHEAQLADSVGRALLVVLDTLAPAERIAFVLHDAFAVPFAEIAPIIERTPAATKKLAGRARAKVRARGTVTGSDLSRHRAVVQTFLTAVRTGDLDTLLAVLAPDVVRSADAAVLRAGMPAELRGAGPVAEEARSSRHRARFAEPALVDGRVGAVVAPHGRLAIALTFTIRDGLIAGYEVIADRARLDALAVTPLEPPRPGHPATR